MNNVRNDKLMNSMKIPRQKKTSFIVKAYGLDFIFEKNEDDCAWYDFDHMLSKNGEAELRIDANREVYAFFKKNKDAKEIQGTIQDEDDNVLPDNFCVDNGYIYHFVKCKKQGYFV